MCPCRTGGWRSAWYPSPSGIRAGSRLRGAHPSPLWPLAPRYGLHYESVTLAEVAGSDGHIVVDAEAIDGMPTAGVVPRGSDTSEPVPPLAAHDLVDAVQDAPDGQPGTVLCGLVEVGVQYGDVAAVRGLGPQRNDVLEVLLGVDEPDVLVGDHSVDGADVLDAGVTEVEPLLE